MSVGMHIKDRPEYSTKSEVMTFSSETKVIDAVKCMSQKNYGSCVIVDENNMPEGIVTERDLMRRLIAENLDPKTTMLSDIMTRELKVARPQDRIIDWLRLMSNERFRHVPVVDEDGKLVNLMSQGDFVSYTWPQLHLGNNYQLYYVLGAFMIYSLAALWAFLSIS